MGPKEAGVVAPDYSSQNRTPVLVADTDFKERNSLTSLTRTGTNFNSWRDNLKGAATRRKPVFAAGTRLTFTVIALFFFTHVFILRFMTHPVYLERGILRQQQCSHLESSSMYHTAFFLLSPISNASFQVLSFLSPHSGRAPSPPSTRYTAQVRTAVAHDGIVLSLAPFLLSLSSREEDASISRRKSIGKRSKSSDIVS